jgi:hypothetical protein
VLDAIALTERQHVGVIERHRPTLRELDVERPKPEVDPDGVVQRVERRR